MARSSRASTTRSGPGTARPWRRSSSRNGSRPFAGALWILGVLVLSCTPTPAPLTADRTIVPAGDGRYLVTETWLMERYQLERSLRLRLERCEARQEGAAAVRPARGHP